MKPSRLILKALGKMLKVPDIAMEMFDAANQASGLNTQTLPTELIPLNSIQLSRGLLNFTLLQTIRNWILPYWAEQQYNPASTCFIPRSHLGLSMNITNRNWTAIGNPHCPIEPIVDPRGLLTPLRNGWSIDVWIAMDGVTFFPSRSGDVEQTLLNDLPIVSTRFRPEEVDLVLTSYTQGDRVIHQVEVHNATREHKQFVVAISVRPFNPEGISLIHDLQFNPSSCTFCVNDDAPLHLLQTPNFVSCSSYEDGDCAESFGESCDGRSKDKVHCSIGLASGFAGYRLELDGNQSATLSCRVDLVPGKEKIQATSSVKQAVAAWTALLDHGTMIVTPDPLINAMVKASLSSLLMLTDGDDITPGPFTYHQFWFRDAAYMLGALDKFGFSALTEPIIRTFPDRQERSGFFRSQRGEWDSNGQALWTVWQHFLHSHDKAILEDSFTFLAKGIKWIEKMRLNERQYRGAPFFGLLPAGLSAEHLGLADYYFWDNAWSIAGIEAFINVCELLGHEQEGRRAKILAADYGADIERAIQHSQQQHHFMGITAAPTRGADCGMIGSCCFWYPLQILPPDDRRMMDTVDTLLERYTVDEMFFQDFVHSGMNAYLTLHIAQALLYAGDRQRFWTLFAAVLSRASSTLTYPEAIHPSTGGGSMGDGHHGWASAEVLHSMRDAFVQERWNPATQRYDLLFCAGLPRTWFTNGNSFTIDSTPTPHGTISLSIECNRGQTIVVIGLEKGNATAAGTWTLDLPLVADEIHIDNSVGTEWTITGRETHIALHPGSATVRVLHTG